MLGKVSALYRADAEQHEPRRIDEAIADNSEMVMNDCRHEPRKVVPCLERARSVAELEHDCLIPLDPDGSEGQALP
jgi:hypothetical protein